MRIAVGDRVRLAHGAMPSVGEVYDVSIDGVDETGDKDEAKVQFDRDAAGSWVRARELEVVETVADRAARLEAETTKLDARVTELQTKCTATENDRRMWKARAVAAQEILRLLVLETSILQRMVGNGCTEAEVQDLVSNAAAVHARIDLLERDAWTAAGAIARELVRDVDHSRCLAEDGIGGEVVVARGRGVALAILEKYVRRFREVLR